MKAMALLRRVTCTALFALFFSASTFAQTGQITGTVVDSTSGNPLPGVNIVVIGTQQGASTDANGEYTITGVEEGTYDMQASFIGYSTNTKEDIEVEAGETVSVNFALAERALELEEVVAVGYGVQQERSISSSVSEISGEEIAELNVTEPTRALQGIAPGVSVVDRGGAPGRANVDINIRGVTSLSGNDPLVLVDGIERSLSSVNPNEIESVSVLKDAAATSIYGSRAANGVILVTTKGPQSGDLTVSYNTYVGMERLSNKPEHLGLEEYIRLQNVSRENLPGEAEPFMTEGEIQEYVNAEDRLKYPLPNVMWDAVFHPGPVQNHSLSFTGGTERLSARLGLSYSDQAGIIPNYDATEKALRLAADYDVSDRINLTGRLDYRRSDNLQPSDVFNVYWRLWHSSQWTVPKYPDGTYGLSEQGRNPLLSAEMSGDDRHSTDHFVINLKAEAELLKNLRFTTQFGGNTSLATNDEFANEYIVRDYYTGEVLRETPYNSLNEYRARNQHWTWNGRFNYNLSLNENELQLLAGLEQTWDDSEWMNAFRNQFYNNQLRVLSAGSEENWSNNGGEVETRLRSAFGRVRYIYADKYIATANARYDGSSKFYGGDNQYSFFPAFSAAWRVSEESFWKPIQPVVNSFKLRGSWGKTGNNTVAPYTFFRNVNIGSNYTFGGDLARTAVVPGLVNRSLTWETTTQWDIGLDAELFDDLFSFTLDFYKKRTEGILLTLPISDLIGLSAPPQNAGRVDNVGWELSLAHQNNVNSDFGYSIRANLSDFRNEVVDLADTGPYPGFNVTKVGEPISALWGYKALGLFESEEEIANYPTRAGKNRTFPGDIKYADLNGDGVISPEDRTVIGEEAPHYSYGVTTNVNFKNFDFRFFLQGVGQQDRVPIGAAIEGGNWEGFTLDIAGDYWTPENTDARFPRPQKYSLKNQAGNEAASSSWWVIDASYLKLKNIQLGYTLPSGLTQTVGASNLRIYIGGTDLFTISEATKWGLDPEFPSGRLNYYPQTSRYTIGANLVF